MVYQGRQFLPFLSLAVGLSLAWLCSFPRTKFSRSIAALAVAGFFVVFLVRQDNPFDMPPRRWITESERATLEKLKTITLNEDRVYFQIGNLFKTHGDTESYSQVDPFVEYYSDGLFLGVKSPALFEKDFAFMHSRQKGPFTTIVIFPESLRAAVIKHLSGFPTSILEPFDLNGVLTQAAVVRR